MKIMFNWLIGKPLIAAAGFLMTFGVTRLSVAAGKRNRSAFAKRVHRFAEKGKKFAAERGQLCRKSRP
jgi:hypothetical protein